MINPESTIRLSSDKDNLIFPQYSTAPEDPFIRKINKSGEKWITFTGKNQISRIVLDADGFVRSEAFGGDSEIFSNNPIKADIVLYWSVNNKRIITGADILGKLLKGI